MREGQVPGRKPRQAEGAEWSRRGRMVRESRRASAEEATPEQTSERSEEASSAQISEKVFKHRAADAKAWPFLVLWELS